MNSLNIVDHPLAKYWLTKLRDRNTSATLFRHACTELSIILAYEALRNILVVETEIETPMEATIGFDIGQKVCFVPIMRTGNLLIEGVVQLYPDAQVIPIGLRRVQNGTIIEYDAELYRSNEKLYCVIVDGIVGTGKTLSRALDICKNSWPQANYITTSFIGLKTGFDRVKDNHPDASNWVIALDQRENSQGYMLPGVGDIRRRAYNTDRVPL